MKPSIQPRDRIAATPQSTPSPRWALAGLSLSVLLSSLGVSIASVALPTLGQAFGASFQAVQWVVLAYLVASTGFVAIAGRLGDLMGRRRLLLAGIALFVAASVLCAVAPGLWLLVAGRAAQGIGAAIMLPLAMALVGDAVPKARTGRAMGLLGTMSAVGTALGPSVGGLLVAGFGWRAIFLLCLPLGAAAFALVGRFLPADGARPQHQGVDLPGSLLLVATLAAYAVAMTAGRNLAPALLAAAAIGVALFVLVERRSASPAIRLSMLRAPDLRAGLAMSALVSSVVMATMVVGPFYLARALGLDAAAVGLVLSAGPVATALAGVPAGRLADRWGTRRMTVAGLAAMVVGATLLAALPASLGIPGYVAPILVLTAGYALFQTANNAAVMAAAGAEERGAVSGVLNLSRYLGLITGASAMGAVFAWGAGAGGAGAADIATVSPQAIGAGFATAFAVAALLAGAALFLALGRTRAPR